VVKQEIRSITEQYLEALRDLADWVTVSEWAIHVGKMFPDLLEKANEDAKNQKRSTTGLRELAARISSNITRNAYDGKIQLDETERPRRVRYHNESDANEVSDDVEEVDRDEKKALDREKWNANDAYRFDELEKICKALSEYCGVRFELDHAKALGNKAEPGNHHPDNLQILIKGHNAKKNDSNWKRFSFDEQIEYLRTMLRAYEIIANKNKLNIEEKIVELLIDRLRLVY
jgi:hypothetical protein